MFLLGAGESVDLRGEGLDAAAQSVYPDGEGGAARVYATARDPLAFTNGSLVTDPRVRTLT